MGRFRIEFTLRGSTEIDAIDEETAQDIFNERCYEDMAQDANESEITSCEEQEDYKDDEDE